MVVENLNKKALIIGDNNKDKLISSYLKNNGFWVRYTSGYNLIEPEYTGIDDIQTGELTHENFVSQLFKSPTQQLAFDSKEAFDQVYVFNDFDLQDDNIYYDKHLKKINLIAQYASYFSVKSICLLNSYDVYKKLKTFDEQKESDCYPANPESAKGWSQIISEKIFFNRLKTDQLNIKIMRLGDIVGKHIVTSNMKHILQSVQEVDYNANQPLCVIQDEDYVKTIFALMNSTYNGPMNIYTNKLTIQQMLSIVNKDSHLVFTNKKILPVMSNDFLMWYTSVKNRDIHYNNSIDTIIDEANILCKTNIN